MAYKRRRHSAPKLQGKWVNRLQVPPRFELQSLDLESRVLTIAPWNRLPSLWLCTCGNFLLYDNAYMFCVSTNSWKSLLAILSTWLYGSVGGVVASIAAFQAVDLGSIPGRRKEVFWDLDSIQEDLDSIQGDLVTPAIDVISPRFVAQPFSTLLLKKCQHLAAHFLCLQVRASVILDIHQLIGSA